ncbi:MAG: 2-oxoacid:acceptor oxidoreductase family protein [Saccharofermentanales bacterium]
MAEFALIISGFGGQGVLSAGRLVATAGLIEDKEVSWLPSYGPEMRGGTANCNVIISDELIGSPLINNCDALIALNLPSLEKFEPYVKPNGMIFVDSSLVHAKAKRADITFIAIPASEIASDMGNMTFAGIVLLGALSHKTGVFSRDSFEEALKEVLPAKHHHLIPQEMEAFDKGKD